MKKKCAFYEICKKRIILKCADALMRRNAPFMLAPLLDIILFGVLTLFYYCTPESSKMFEIANSFENLKNHHSRLKEDIYPGGF